MVSGQPYYTGLYQTGLDNTRPDRTRQDQTGPVRLDRTRLNRPRVQQIEETYFLLNFIKSFSWKEDKGRKS